MNYTENYHLPQWVKSDRIMMEDFNDAMGSIEDGLTTGGRAKAQAENICRDAYRQEVQLRLRHGVGGALDAMWVNPLASREDAGGDGHAWNGKYGVWLGEGILPTEEGLKKTAKEVSTIRLGTVSDVYQAVTTFTSDGYGMLESLLIWYSDSSYSSQPAFDHTIRLVRTDTGELVKEAGPFTTNHQGFITYRTDFPLEATVPYRLEITLPANISYQGEIGFMLGTERYVDPNRIPLVIGPRTVDNTIVKIVNIPENINKAVGIVRWMGSGTLEMSLGESIGTILRTRDAINALGQPCKETEFLLDNIPAGQAEAALQMNKGAGDLQVFDYGLLWK